MITSCCGIHHHEIPVRIPIAGDESHPKWIYIYMYMFGLYPYQKSPIPLISSAQLLHCQAICRIGAGRAHVVTWLLGTCHWLLGKLQTFKGQRSMWIYRIKKTYVYVYIYIHRSNILDTVRYEYIICHIKTWGS